MSSTKTLHYFDHNATTPICQEVVEALPRLAQSWGNASSIHWAGREPKHILRETRKTVADIIGAKSPLEIIFTSGGSESNNTVIKGVFEYLRSAPFVEARLKGRNHYMCSSVEHPAIIKTMEFLQSEGAKVDFIPVSRSGQIDMEFYKAHLSEDTALVTVMIANNETGNIFPIKEMTELAHEKGALFHTDGVQALGKIPVNVTELGVDFATFSAHKFYSLKGAGFLYSKKGSHFTSLIHGGGQERHRRGGTENILGIAAMGVAAERLKRLGEVAPEMTRLRDLFEQRVLSEIQNVSVTGSESLRVPNTSSLVITGADGETLLMSLDLEGYAVSTGAACSSGNPEPSPVLLNMGLSRQEAQNSLRVSIGWDTTEEEIHKFVETLKVVVTRLRSIQSDEGETYHV